VKLFAIIPARAGSQRLPGKNVKTLGDFPLLAHTILSAEESGCFEKIIVSTEDASIAKIAENYGAEVPFLRPADLATHASNVVDAVVHMIDQLKKQNEYYDAVMLLQPTSPFRKPETIQAAVNIFLRSKGASVISVSPAKTHPYWCKSIDEEGNLHAFIAGQDNPARYQDLPPAYELNGLIYLASVEELMKHKSFYGTRTQALLIQDPREIIDIDTEEDWLLAEQSIKQKELA
jgi:CMP-N,N'-diacetyllegionaminic acid synthase